ncbi:MAG: hypothetical protein MZW92_39305 [Comamonadaceae bacterium]|nr:hypothetical protein [Comamonadaceae bacterium]
MVGRAVTKRLLFPEERHRGRRRSRSSGRTSCATDDEGRRAWCWRRKWAWPTTSAWPRRSPASTSSCPPTCTRKRREPGRHRRRHADRRGRPGRHPRSARSR